MRLFRVSVRLCAILGALVLGASYLGAVHPLGDSLAVFRDLIAYALAAVSLAAFLLRLWGIGTVSAMAAAATVLHIASFNQLHTPAPMRTPDVSVYAKNIGAGRVDWVAMLRDIRSAGVDIVLLQEVTRPLADDLPRLLPDHPYQHICRFSDWSAMVVAARWPLSDPSCTSHRSLAFATVAVPSGAVWVASIHQVWPYPHDQALLLPDIIAAVDDAPARQIVAGDFNMVPWGHSVRAIAQAGGLTRISPVLPTIEVRGLGLPIDHVLTDGQGTVTLRPRLRSDHFGLYAQISW